MPSSALLSDSEWVHVVPAEAARRDALRTLASSAAAAASVRAAAAAGVGQLSAGVASAGADGASAAGRYQRHPHSQARWRAWTPFGVLSLTDEA